MKNIVKTLFLLGVLNQSLLGNFSITYKLNSSGSEFNSTQDPSGNDHYTVGITTLPVLFDGDQNNTFWFDSNASLNPVYQFNAAKIVELFGANSAASSSSKYAIISMPSSGNAGNVTYKEVILETDTGLQYSGKPIILELRASASTSGDYKGDTYQNGEVVMWYFPVLDIGRVDQEGIYLEALYHTGDGNWTKCDTGDMEIDPDGVQYEGIDGNKSEDIWGDLNDFYPTQLVWNAKQGLPDYDGNITMRVKIKYGTTAD